MCDLGEGLAFPGHVVAGARVQVPQLLVTGADVVVVALLAEEDLCSSLIERHAGVQHAVFVGVVGGTDLHHQKRRLVIVFLGLIRPLPARLLAVARPVPSLTTVKALVFGDAPASATTASSLLGAPMASSASATPATAWNRGLFPYFLFAHVVGE